MAHATTTRGVAPDPHVADLAIDFDLTLAAQNKSTATRKVYGTGVAQFAAFLKDRGMPIEAVNVRREHVEAFIADVLARRSASTAKTRYGALQVFCTVAELEARDDGDITSVTVHAGTASSRHGRVEFRRASGVEQPPENR